ncbi:DUF3888 domain-containing protein [Cytobacillus praedii]|uniref:DUF3888 domain-containing protein n=1 Tax=Cytobacillus praedii TaxID=1742358 RepID=UPI002E242F2F|nr:DUF3888 domain-containing protein [Cytobacillus praedii]
MKKLFFPLIIAITIVCSFQIKAEARIPRPSHDSEQLRLQDMFMLMLYPYIKEELNKYYYPILKTYSPEIELWKVEVIETKRVNGFRGFILEITFDIEPSTAHHVSIGKDRMTYRISYGPEVRLINHTHLKTYKLPPQ